MADLTSLSDVRAWVNTGQSPYPTTDDALLARLITDCSAYIENWLSRPIGVARWQEIRDGLGGYRPWQMQLAVTPIISIESLIINGIPIPPAIPPGQPIMSGQPWAGYTFSPSILALRGYVFWRGVQNVVIQYTAGFDPIPGDIRQVCIEMVTRKYRERLRVAEKSKTIGGIETVAYETTMFSRQDMSDIHVLLRQYKQVMPTGLVTRLPDLPEPFVLEDGVPPVIEVELEDSVTPIDVEQ